MRLSLVSLYCVIGALLLALPGAVQAGVINFTELDFTNPILAVGSGSFVSMSGSSSGYSLSGSLSCDFCTSSSGNDSTLDLTSLNITCSTPGGCGSLDIEFDAQNGNGNAGDSLLPEFQLSGSGDSVSGFAQFCIADTQNICLANGNGTESVSISFSGQPSGSNSSGFNLNGEFSIFGDFHLDGLSADSTGVTVSDLSISLPVAEGDMGGGGGVGSPPPLPEPSTLLLCLAGLAGIYVIGNRRAQRRLELNTRELKNSLKAW